MAPIKKVSLLASAAAVAAVMFAPLAATASAQTGLPYLVYGTGLETGQTVTAIVDGQVCGTSDVEATQGGWFIEITPDCASQGDVINFEIDGEAATPDRQIIADFNDADLQVDQPITLQAGGATPTPTATPTATPAPGQTGNAGLSGSTGTSLMLILALGVFASAVVAGGRSVTRRR